MSTEEEEVVLETSRRCVFSGALALGFLRFKRSRGDDRETISTEAGLIREAVDITRQIVLGVDELTPALIDRAGELDRLALAFRELM
ncbi:MAG TPA: hypothetical protein VGO11_19720 [Chthoniobacteraceae bacterium]|jgi:hypothetical protein|nr:hypothetical protein [Chthoniobacteraceae bacterium]